MTWPDNAPIRAVVLDFMGVCATARMATSYDDVETDYVLEVDRSVIELVFNLSASGLRTGLLTNNDRCAFTRHHSDIDLESWFDAVVFSSDVGVNKPNPAIYRAMLSRLGVSASQCLYIDDLARNVDAARQVGMHGEVAETPRAASAILRRFARSLNEPQ